MFSGDVWLECGEKGGDCDGDDEKKYFWWPGPTLTGRGDGGVGGEDEGEAKSISITPSKEREFEDQNICFCWGFFENYPPSSSLGVT